MGSGLSACIVNATMPWNGPQLEQPRTQLTLDQLNDDIIMPLLDMSFFARPDWASEATHDFSGTLSFADTPMTYPKERSAYEGEDLFPAFQARFITHAGRLIPAEQDLLRTHAKSESMWDVLLGAGKVWHEASDGDWNRASFPLSLTDRFIGQVRNCVASFAYTPEKVSKVYLQCSQETADANDGRLGNLRAILKSEYAADPELDATAIKEHWLETEQQRMPVQPLRTRDNDHEIAAYFDKIFKTHASTSLGAVLHAGQLYLHPPQTRHGLYPYPLEMRHGLYSVTKSMAGALALFYFAERYDSAIFDARITDYVPPLAQHPGWQNVTFSQALNMVTGTEGGEGAEQLLNILIVAESAEESINNVATLGDAPASPGDSFNYASTNLFVLSYALQNYVAQKEGPETDYWELVKEQVLIPIGAPHFNLQRTLEKDGSPGIPFLAYGATPTLDEAAKIATLITQEGEFNGRQILNKTRVREALGRTAWAGHDTGGDWRGQSYRHGFWASSVQTSRCTLPVSFMLGFGGNYVIFLPNNSVIFRFMDEYDFDYADLVRRVEKHFPLCQDGA